MTLLTEIHRGSMFYDCKMAGTEQAEIIFSCLIIHPVSLLGAWDSQSGYRGGWRRTMDKKQIMAILADWPTAKENKSQFKMALFILN